MRVGANVNKLKPDPSPRPLLGFCIKEIDTTRVGEKTSQIKDRAGQRHLP